MLKQICSITAISVFFVTQTNSMLIPTLLRNIPKISPQNIQTRQLLKKNIKAQKIIKKLYCNIPTSNLEELQQKLLKSIEDKQSETANKINTAEKKRIRCKILKYSLILGSGTTLATLHLLDSQETFWFTVFFSLIIIPNVYNIDDVMMIKEKLEYLKQTQKGIDLLKRQIKQFNNQTKYNENQLKDIENKAKDLLKKISESDSDFFINIFRKYEELSRNELAKEILEIQKHTPQDKE